jgi:hypothetical protein
MAGTELQEGRDLSPASILLTERQRTARRHLRTARVKPAPRRDPGWIGRLPGQDAASGQVAVPLGGHLQEGSGIGMEGPGQNLFGRAELDDLPQVHDGHPIGQGPGQAEVVGDHQQGQAVLVS